MIKAIAIIVLFLDALASACPLCRDSVARGPAGGPQAAGFNSSIEWMLGGTFLVMGWVAVRVWHSVRNASLRG